MTSPSLLEIQIKISNYESLPVVVVVDGDDGGNAQAPEGNWEKGVKNSLLRHVVVVDVVAVSDTNGHFDRRKAVRKEEEGRKNRTCNMPRGACI